MNRGPGPWLDRQAYPFVSRWLDLPEGPVHYVDEGTGPPLLMVHGTPTWSFLYRHLIRALRGRYRCVAPDLPGFGLSAKPAGASYHPRDQAARLARLVETLGLEHLTLVVHDFGGPIGLAHAIEHPENVRALVLFNTWMWSLAADRRVAWPGRVLGSPVGRVLYERLGFSVNVVWRRAIGDRARYTPAVHRHYAAPLATVRERHATWVYARALLGASDWYEGLWQQRQRLAAIPALLIWGAADPAFGRFLDRWRQALPHAEVLRLDGVGHAPPEERGPESAAAIARFLEGGPDPAGAGGARAEDVIPRAAPAVPGRPAPPPAPRDGRDAEPRPPAGAGGARADGAIPRAAPAAPGRPAPQPATPGGMGGRPAPPHLYRRHR